MWIHLIRTESGESFIKVVLKGVRICLKGKTNWRKNVSPGSVSGSSLEQGPIGLTNSSLGFAPC